MNLSYEQAKNKLIELNGRKGLNDPIQKFITGLNTINENHLYDEIFAEILTRVATLTEKVINEQQKLSSGNGDAIFDTEESLKFEKEVLAEADRIKSYISSHNTFGKLVVAFLFKLIGNFLKLFENIPLIGEGIGKKGDEFIADSNAINAKSKAIHTVWDQTHTFFFNAWRKEDAPLSLVPPLIKQIREKEYVY